MDARGRSLPAPALALALALLLALAPPARALSSVPRSTDLGAARVLLPTPAAALQSGARREPSGQDDGAPEAVPEAEASAAGFSQHIVADNTHFVMYYIHSRGFTKHPDADYAAGLEEQCSALANVTDPQRGVDAVVVGSTDWVQENAPSCADFAKSGSGLFADTDLQYAEATARLWSNCSQKFSQRAWFSKLPGVEPMKPIGDFHAASSIWLNKLPALCSRATRNPDEVTVLVDANLIHNKPDAYADALRVSAQLRPGRLGIPHYNWYETVLPFFNWYGQWSCDTAPYLRAKFVALRGRDCPAIMEFYNATLSKVSSNPACGCFDEEIVLAKMHDEKPELFDSRWKMAPWA